MLSIVIPCCGIGTYVLSNSAIDLRTHGIKVVGQVIGFRSESSVLWSGGRASGTFPIIKYVDASGTTRTIRGSLAKPLSRLSAGDFVEVIYPARDPDQGFLNRWYELYLVPIFFGSMTFAFLVMLCLVLRGTRLR